jgi:RNA polymerase sigma factor (sigma-70 family)
MEILAAMEIVSSRNGTRAVTEGVHPLEKSRELAQDELERAFSLYQRELLGTLFFLVGNHEDAQDALQETFIKCWRHRDQVPGIENLRAWLFRVALNTGRDLRQTAWQRKRQHLPEDAPVTDSRKTDPVQAAEENEQRILVERAIRKLRPEEQEVFLLRQNGQLKYEEIASALAIPLGTVKTRMRMALAAIRETLSEL